MSPVPLVHTLTLSRSRITGEREEEKEDNKGVRMYHNAHLPYLEEVAAFQEGESSLAPNKPQTKPPPCYSVSTSFITLF